MAQTTSLDFGAPEVVDASLSDRVRGLTGSEILKIAADIRELQDSGQAVCNLTVGDFDPRQFPIPRRLLTELQRALDEGETNYPPSDGMPQLRRAVLDYVEREWGPRYPLESVLIASGARPILYATYRSVLDPGDVALYPVPSWNNNHYAWICGAEPVEVANHAADGFMPTVEQLRPHLGRARLLCLNSPLNPSGTVIDKERLRAVTQALVEENRRRTREGRKHLFLLYDQVYASLVFGSTRHHLPVALVPESAPWVLILDGISKSLAATGLRVGWVLAAPRVTARMKSLIGHIGAWAPRAEQVALSRFLADPQAVQAFREVMNHQVHERLHALHGGFERLRQEGYPVECVHPQGAIYLSLRLDLVGRTIGGRRLDGNEAIRKLLLDEAQLAVVPFQAFGLQEETGWFRLSVGAVSLADIEAAFPRLRALLDRV